MSADGIVNNNSKIRSKTHVIGQALTSCKSFFKRINTRKLMRTLQAEIETQNEMRRTLNCIQLIAIGLGCIIGIGIFVFSGQAAAKYSGPSVIISFILSGIVALFATLSLSEMAAMMASSGSAYTYTYIALGEYAAWFVACNLAVMYQLAASTVVVGCSKYVVHFVRIISNHNMTASIVQSPIVCRKDADMFAVIGAFLDLPAIIITILITLLLISGIRQTATVNLIFVVLKIIILLIFIFACCKYIDVSNYTPFFPPNQGSFGEFGVTGILQASTFVFLAYIGFEAVTAAAQETKEPTRSLPIAIIGSLVISMLFYLGICTVMIGLVPFKLLDTNNPLSEAIKATPYGLWLLIIMDLGAIISLTSVALTLLLAQTRIFYAMAHDGLLPSFFARIHSRTKTPWITTIISGILCAVISGVCPVDIVGEITLVSALIIYFFVHVSVIVMRYTHSYMPRNFQVPLGAWPIPAVGALLCLLFLINTSKETGIRTGICMGIGQIIYFSYGFWHSKTRSRKRRESTNSLSEFLPMLTVIDMNNTYKNSELNLTYESTTSQDKKSCFRTLEHISVRPSEETLTRDRNLNHDSL